MKWNIEKAVLTCQRLGHLAENRMYELSLLPDREKLQLLFDMSKLECQRVNVLEMFELITGKTLDIQPWDSRVVDIIFPIGTPIWFYDEHADHGYAIQDTHLICSHTVSKRWQRPAMKAMDMYGTVGNNFMVYGIKRLGFRFVTDLEELARYFGNWLVDISPASEQGLLLQAIGVADE